MDLHERIEGCKSVEDSMALLYDMLSRLDPEGREFYDSMREDELRHTLILDTADKMFIIGYGKDRTPPPEPALVQRTKKLVEEAAERLLSGTLTIEDALYTALTLEQTAVERFYLALIEGRTEDEKNKALFDLYIEEKGHIDKLRAFMAKRGLLKDS